MLKYFTNKYKTDWRFSIATLALLLLLFMTFEIKNGRFDMKDFHVYYVAADRLMAGENMYRPVEDGHFHFKYSPESALFFVPLAIFPYGAARVIFWLILTAVICANLYMSILLVKPDFKSDDAGRLNGKILLAALILGVHAQRELHLGQVNQILLLMYLGLVLLVRNQKNISAAALWAISMFIKPYGLIFLPYYLLKKKFKPIVIFIVFTAGIALTPAAIYGWHGSIIQHGFWLRELSVELSDKRDLLASANHTIFSIMARYTPLRLIHWSGHSTLIFQVTIIILLAGLFLYLMRRGKGLSDSSMLESGFLIALIPTLAATSHNAYGFFELIVVLIIFKWHELNKIEKALALAGFIFTGGNMYDLVGLKAWQVINNLSIIAIGGLLLLAVVALIRKRRLA